MSKLWLINDRYSMNQNYGFYNMLHSNIHTDSLTFAIREHLCTLTLQPKGLIFNAVNQQTGKQIQTVLNNQSIYQQTKQQFCNVQQIFSYLTEMNRNNKNQLQDRCSIHGDIFSIKIDENCKENSDKQQILQISLAAKVEQLSAYQKLKKGIILQQLNQFRSSRMIKTKLDNDAKPKAQDLKPQHTFLSEDCKWEFLKLNSRVTSMALALQEYSKELQAMKQKVDNTSVETALISYEKRQESVLVKLTKIGEEIIKLKMDKKETAHKFQEQAAEMWEQIGRVREMLKNPLNFSIGDYSLSQINTSILGQLTREYQSSVRSRQAKPKEERLQALHESACEQKPIQFIRKDESLTNSSFCLPNTSFALSEHQIQRFKQGLQDMSIYRKKIRELQKRIESSLPPLQIIPNFSRSKLQSEYIFAKQNGQTSITKKPIDKKCQLVGQALPSSGRSYFKIQLVSVPHGYIHIGFISGSVCDQASSYDSPASVNYFGGNGSVNDKGNGVFVGKQLQDRDVLSVLVDMDCRKAMFVLRRQVLGEVSLRGFELEKGIFPYVQMFYGGSKIKLATN